MRRTTRRQGSMLCESLSDTHVNVSYDTATGLITVDLNEVEQRVCALLAENEKLRDLTERLKLEAQIHSGEARCHSSTVHEIYQLISGAKGEPATWNGAVPVKRFLEKVEHLICAARNVNAWLNKTGRSGCTHQRSLEEALMWMDGKLGTPPAAIPELIKRLGEYHDVAIKMSCKHPEKLIEVIEDCDGHIDVFFTCNLLPKEERSCTTLASYFNGRVIAEDADESC